MTNGLDYFETRKEPPELVGLQGYISLRTCQNVNLLESLLQRMQDQGPDSVVLPWISRPFGIIRGYGLYTLKEAEHIIEKEKNECWPDPLPAHKYDVQWVERRLRKIRQSKGDSEDKILQMVYLPV